MSHYYGVTSIVYRVRVVSQMVHHYFASQLVLTFVWHERKLSQIYLSKYHINIFAFISVISFTFPPVSPKFFSSIFAYFQEWSGSIIVNANIRYSFSSTVSESFEFSFLTLRHRCLDAVLSCVTTPKSKTSDAKFRIYILCMIKIFTSNSKHFQWSPFYFGWHDG